MRDAEQSGWKIFIGDTLIGVAYHRNDDFPWHICTFEPTKAFDLYRPIFDTYAKLVNEPLPQGMVAEDIDAFYEMHIEALNLVLQPFGDVQVGDTVFVAQIYNGNEAWIGSY